MPIARFFNSFLYTSADISLIHRPYMYQTHHTISCAIKNKISLTIAFHLFYLQSLCFKYKTIVLRPVKILKKNHLPLVSLPARSKWFKP